MRLLRDLKLDEVFVLDIETVPCVGCHQELEEMLKELWEHKCHALRREKGWISHHDHIAPLPDALLAASLFEQAGIYAEFGRVVCISVGRFRYVPTGQLRFSVKSFYGHDERKLLQEFSEVISCRPHFRLCGHNAKEFDFPYISRRMLINGLELPPQLDTAGKKPWEVPPLDTMELWTFGDRKSFASLSLLATMFGIPTPKMTCRARMWLGCTMRKMTCPALRAIAKKISSLRHACYKNSGVMRHLRMMQWCMLTRKPYCCDGASPL